MDLTSGIFNMPIQLSQKESLFTQVLIDDFYGELNYMAEMPEHRYSHRIAIMGEWADFQAGVTHPPEMEAITSPVDEETTPLLSQPTVSTHATKIPYAQVIFKERLTIAAKVFIAFCREVHPIFDRYDDETIRYFAMVGVDRILEYVTCPNEKGELPEWSAKNFFAGLFLGDSRRWMTSIQLTKLPVSLQEITAFYSIVDRQRWNIDLSSIDTIYTFQDRDLYAILSFTMDDNDEQGNSPREIGEELHQSIQQFYVNFIAHLDRALLDTNPPLDMVHAMMACIHRMECRLLLFKSTQRTLPFDLGDSLNPADHPLPELKSAGTPIPVENMLADFFRQPKAFDFFHRFFAQSLQHYLILAESSPSQFILFQKIAYYLKENQLPYIPLRISLHEIDKLNIDFNAPFLDQYFIKGLGYNATGVMHLKSHYRFLFFFEGLDLLPQFDSSGEYHYQQLMERLYFGEETADWSTAKIVLTASHAFVPPVRKKSIFIQQATLPDLAFNQLDDWIEAPFHENITEEEEKRKLDIMDFFKNNSFALLPLIASFRDTEKLPFNTESEQFLKIFHLPVSPVLINLVKDLMPFLSVLPKNQWPTNRYALYEFALQKYLEGEEPETYHRLSQIAFMLFENNTLSLKETASPLVNPLKNFTFFSSTAEVSNTGRCYRYAFTQNDFRDYLVAKTLWETRHITEISDKKNAWNFHHFNQKYPGVLDFLVEYFNVSETRLADAVYFYQRWVANGEQTGREKAYKNADDLLNQSVLSQQEWVQAAQETQQARRTLLLTHGATASVSTNFMRTNAHWALRTIERMDASHDTIKKAAFGSLGNGCGVSALSPHYEMVDAFNGKKCYIFANNQDKILGEKLVHLAHQAINRASSQDSHVIKTMIPDSFGFYQRDALLQISKNLNELDFIHAERSYLIALKKSVYIPETASTVTKEKIKERFNAFQTRYADWLQDQEEAYRQKSYTIVHWYDQQDQYVEANVETVAKRLAYYHQQVEERLYQKIKRFKRFINAGDYTKIGQFFTEEEETLEHREQNHQYNIEQLMEGSTQLTEQMYQRFEILMSLSAETQALYESYTAQEKLDLREEVSQGDSRVVQRFKQAFLFASYSDIYDTLKNTLTQIRERHFNQWLDTDPALKAQWQRSKKSQKSLFIEAIKTGDMSAILVLFSIIFDKAQKDAFEAYITQAEAEFFKSCIHQSIAVPAWNTLQPAEKEIIYRQLASMIDEKEEFLQYVQANFHLFEQPSDDYILRYLRFGLSVDACAENTQRDTLLFYALKRLAFFAEEYASGQTAELFNIIQYLVNVGATILVKDDRLNTPRDYVEEQRKKYPHNEQWIKLEQVLDNVMAWFELQERPEERIFKLSSNLYLFSKNYEENILNVSTIESLSDVFNLTSKVMRSTALEQNRRNSVNHVKEKVPHLMNDRFNLSDNLEALKDNARNGERRVRIGRLHGEIYNQVDNCIQGFTNGIPKDAETVSRYKLRTSVVTKQTFSSQVMTFFGRGTLAPDTPEVRGFKQQIRDQKEVLKYKDEAIKHQKEKIRLLVNEANKKSNEEESQENYEQKEGSTKNTDNQRTSPSSAFFQSETKTEAPTTTSEEKYSFSSNSAGGNT